MVGTLIDHMIALVVTGTIFVSAILVVPTLSYVNLLYVDQQQLRNVALDTLKTMLLEPGYPSNWASTYNFDPDQVERFGLALAGSSSFYVLDPDKVQRLLENPAGYMGYEDIRAKLKLEGYGFTFKIIPPFRVVVNDKDFDGWSDPISLANLTEGVKVFVVNNDGHPIPNALVKATLVYGLQKNETIQMFDTRSNTNAVGRCVIRPVIASNVTITDFVIVFQVTVADLKVVTSSYMEGFDQRVINATIINDNVTLTVPEGSGWEKNSAGSRWVGNVVAVTADDEIWNIYSGTQSNEDKITWGGGWWGWSMLFGGLSYTNPLFLIFSLSVPSPRRSVFFLGPEPNWRGFRVSSCGDPTVASPIVKLQRCVTISGMTYIAELTMWKESP